LALPETPLGELTAPSQIPLAGLKGAYLQKYGGGRRERKGNARGGGIPPPLAFPFLSLLPPPYFCK